MPSVLYAHPDGRRKIGCASPPGDDWFTIKWFKLFLLHQDDWPLHAKHSLLLQNSADAARSLYMTPIQVVADYFSQLWPEIKEFASKKMTQSSGDFESLNLHLILTVPACWPEEAMGRMERAVKEAGILETMQSSTLTFMREQAVAAPTLLTWAVKASNELPASQSGELITVCDCGGLTADAATYEISSDADQTYKLDERVPGGSRLCGTMFLEDGFYKCLKAKICSITGNEAVFEKLSSKFWSNASQWWEQTGRSMMLMCHKTNVIDFPHTLEYRGGPMTDLGAPDVHISFSGEEFSSIRESVIEGIIDLVESQVRETCESFGRPPKYVLLSGGLARSSIVRRELAGRIEPPTQIIDAGAHRSELVSCGAVWQVLDDCHRNGSPIVKIESHMTLESYGIRLGQTQLIHWIIDKRVSLSPTKPIGFKVPTDAFAVRKTVAGRGLALTVCRQSPSHNGVKTLCRLTWMKTNPVVSSEDKAYLQVLHDTHHGLSLFLTYNDERIGPERVIVDY